MQELDRLKSVVPSCQGANVSQMEVILQAIQYIEDLQGRLGFQELNRLKSVVPNCQGEDVSHMEIIQKMITYVAIFILIILMKSISKYIVKPYNYNEKNHKANNIVS